METLQVKCVGCGKDFEINGPERRFFEIKSLILPKRCKPCRASRRMLKGGTLHPMGGEHGADMLRE